MNTFRRGGIIWSPGTGAQDVYGAIYTRYKTLGGADLNRLGMPTSGEYAITGGRANTFQGGTITWTPAGGAKVNFPSPTPPPTPTPTQRPFDPRFGTCTEAKSYGYGPCYRGQIEYTWYRGADHDRIVCK